MKGRFILLAAAAALMLGSVGCGGGPSPRKERPPLGPLLMEGAQALDGVLLLTEARLASVGGRPGFVLRLKNRGQRTIRFCFYVRYVGGGRVLIDPVSKPYWQQIRPGEEVTVTGLCAFPEAERIGIRIANR